ncbi:hypothetical protein REPUB_Repub20aG0121900 [Reevesia pubescens]
MREKRMTIRRFTRLWKLEMLFLQETKLKEVDNQVVHTLWFGDSLSFEFSSSIGLASGIITFWDKDFFELEYKIISSIFIVLIGTIKKLNFSCAVLNLYAPNDDGEHFLFWKNCLFCWVIWVCLFSLLVILMLLEQLMKKYELCIIIRQWISLIILLRSSI